MTTSDYTFEARKKCVEHSIKMYLRSPNWRMEFKYQQDAAYNGYLRGDMTRKEYDEILSMLRNADGGLK